MKKIYKTRVIAAVLALCASGAFAADDGSFEYHGYSRGGTTLSYTGSAKGGLSLGGELQKYRLGNEGDNFIEIDLIKKFEKDGVKWKIHYMPSKYQGNAVSTEQAFVEMGGLPFAPEANFWAGQRRLRIQDVHILDNFLLNYGDNRGAGLTDLAIGGAKLGVGIFSSDKFDGNQPIGVKATRLNADISDLKINDGGKLRVLLTSVTGTGLAGSNSGSGVSLLHNQSNFLVKGLNNALFVQSSKGHARIDGQFQGVDGVAGGQKVSRVADSLNWQNGAFGGQTMLGYQKAEDELSGTTTRDSSIGGRISYAVTHNFKMLVEAGSTRRAVSNQADQVLKKITIAPTLALGPDFWSRPELRFYVTKANWNDAAATANAGTLTAPGFGAKGQTSTSLVGVQYEVWW